MTTMIAVAEPSDSRFAYALEAIGEAKASLVELAAETDGQEARDVCRALSDLQNAEATLAHSPYWWQRAA